MNQNMNFLHLFVTIWNRIVIISCPRRLCWATETCRLHLWRHHYPTRWLRWGSRRWISWVKWNTRLPSWVCDLKFNGKLITSNDFYFIWWNDCSSYVWVQLLTAEVFKTQRRLCCAAPHTHMAALAWLGWPAGLYFILLCDSILFFIQTR